MRRIAPSELIINDDGSIFHLHLKPGQIADTVILVGDPGRVDKIASYFDDAEFRTSNREFVTVTGRHKGKRMTVLSTGIGTDNIDIVVNELDALANIDFTTRREKPQKTKLTLVRLGTCGGLQPDIRLGDLILSRTSVGFDGLLNFYKGRDAVCDLPMEQAFKEHTGWNPQLVSPYFINCSDRLAALFTVPPVPLAAPATAHDSASPSPRLIEGITISAPGFYAPQGRWLRLEPADTRLNEKIESFRWHDRRITNFEMEGSAFAGLAALMGHDAVTICTVIAQRAALDMETDYRQFVDKMIVMSLEKLSKL